MDKEVRKITEEEKFLMEWYSFDWNEKIKELKEKHDTST